MPPERASPVVVPQRSKSNQTSDVGVARTVRAYTSNSSSRRGCNASITVSARDTFETLEHTDGDIVVPAIAVLYVAPSTVAEPQARRGRFSARHRVRNGTRR
jgi:hypothetical protein